LNTVGVIAGGMSARKKSGLTASVSNLPTMPEDEDVRNMSVEELVVRYVAKIQGQEISIVNFNYR
jgi:hypothetical protein